MATMETRGIESPDQDPAVPGRRSHGRRHTRGNSRWGRNLLTGLAVVQGREADRWNRVAHDTGHRRSVDAKDVEILILRHQLEVLHRRKGRPRFRSHDRMLLAALARVLPRDRWRCLLVRPETVLRWPASWSRAAPVSGGGRAQEGLRRRKISGETSWSACKKTCAGVTCPSADELKRSAATFRRLRSGCWEHLFGSCP